MMIHAFVHWHAGDTVAADALDSDRDLAQLCAQQALAAVDGCEHETIARFCSGVAEYYQFFSLWQPQTPHPAANTNPAVFRSFEATLSKFVN